MKSILTQVFVSLGVVFLILIFVGIYFFITDPYGLKPMLFGSSAPTQSSSAPVSDTANNAETSNGTSTNTASEPVASGGFELSGAQVEALIGLGIDPAAIPSSISAEQESCFAGELGEARVEEIKAGAVPSAFEFLQAKSCI